MNINNDYLDKLEILFPDNAKFTVREITAAKKLGLFEGEFNKIQLLVFDSRGYDDTLTSYGCIDVKYTKDSKEISPHSRERVISDIVANLSNKLYIGDDYRAAQECIMNYAIKFNRDDFKGVLKELKNNTDIESGEKVIDTLIEVIEMGYLKANLGKVKFEYCGNRIMNVTSNKYLNSTLERLCNLDRRCDSNRDMREEIRSISEVITRQNGVTLKDVLFAGENLNIGKKSDMNCFIKRVDSLFSEIMTSTEKETLLKSYYVIREFVLPILMLKDNVKADEIPSIIWRKQENGQFMWEDNK